MMIYLGSAVGVCCATLDPSSDIVISNLLMCNCYPVKGTILELSNVLYSIEQFAWLHI